MANPKDWKESWSEPINVGTTIKAIHFNELRTLIEQYETNPQGEGRSSPRSWTSGTIAVGNVIKASHYNELKARITNLKTGGSSGSFPAAWSDVSVGGNITAAQMNALRDNLKYVYHTCFICYSCETCYSSCVYCDYCDSVCDSCDYCDSSCDVGCHRCAVCVACYYCYHKCDLCDEECYMACYYGDSTCYACFRCDSQCYECYECEYD